MSKRKIKSDYGGSSANQRFINISEREYFKLNVRGHSISEWMNDLQRKTAKTLIDEYNTIRGRSSEASSLFAFTGFFQNEEKNRYKDVPCHDHTRVYLKNGQDGGEGDYIHASFVKGIKRTWICTQGPTEDTAYDFWRMIWQEEIIIIVMLCKKVEGNLEKCFDYWPEIENETLHFNEITIKTKRCSRKNGFTETILELKRKRKETSRKILHIGYNSWPDKGQPISEAAVLQLLRIVEGYRDSMASQNSIVHPKELVHCSAGIGRTGTLVALSICIEFLNHSNNNFLPSIQDVITHVRNCRSFAVQTSGQYAFVYTAVLEYLKTHKLIESDRDKKIAEKFKSEAAMVPKLIITRSALGKRGILSSRRRATKP